MDKEKIKEKIKKLDLEIKELELKTYKNKHFRLGMFYGYMLGSFLTFVVAAIIL